MRNEHAITYIEKISMKDLAYLVKKANRLGKSNKEVVNIYQTEDSEGFHVYFEVTGLKEEEWRTETELKA